MTQSLLDKKRVKVRNQNDISSSNIFKQILVWKITRYPKNELSFIVFILCGVKQRPRAYGHKIAVKYENSSRPNYARVE